jgi:hypothetical protein
LDGVSTRILIMESKNLSSYSYNTIIETSTKTT